MHYELVKANNVYKKPTLLLYYVFVSVNYCQIQTVGNSGFFFFLLKLILGGLNDSWNMSTCPRRALGGISILSTSVAFLSPGGDGSVLCLSFMLVQALLPVRMLKDRQEY